MILHCLSCPVVCVGQNRSYQITSSHDMCHFASRRCMNLEGRKEKGRVLVSWERLKMRGPLMTLGSQQDKPWRRTDVKMQVGLKTQKHVWTVHLQASFGSAANTYTKKQPFPPPPLHFFWGALYLSYSGSSHVGLLCTNEEQKRVESTHTGVNQQSK